MVFGRDGSEADRGDLTTSCARGDCVSGASPFWSNVGSCTMPWKLGACGWGAVGRQVGVCSGMKVLEFGKHFHALLAFEVIHTFECGHKVMKSFHHCIGRGNCGLSDVFCLKYTVSERLSMHVALTKM